MVKGFGLDACLAVMNGTCPLWPHIMLRQVHLYVYSKVLSQFTRIILCGRDVKEKICVLWYKLSLHFAQNLLDIKVCCVPCKRVKAADCLLQWCCISQCFNSNGTVQEEEVEVAPTVVAEKSKVTEETEIEPDIDSLDIDEEQSFEKVEPAQPVETPAEPEPEPQPGRTFSCFLSFVLHWSLVLCFTVNLMNCCCQVLVECRQRTVVSARCLAFLCVLTL